MSRVVSEDTDKLPPPRRVLTPVQYAALERVRRASENLDAAKHELNRAIRDAGHVGLSVRAVAEVAPFRFQRVSQIMRGE